MTPNIINKHNPLIDKHTLHTLKNIKSMIVQIQEFAKKYFDRKSCQPQCPATELYVRLLMMLNEAIEYEIEQNTFK